MKWVLRYGGYWIYRIYFNKAMSDNKAKGSSASSDEEPSFFKGRVFISIVLAVVFFLMGYVFAQSPKSSKSSKGKNQKKGKTGSSSKASKN